MTVGELAETIIQIANPNARIICEQERTRPQKSEVMKLVCDNTLARKVAGWNPKYSLEDGLAITIAWMKEHLGTYKAGTYTV